MKNKILVLSAFAASLNLACNTLTDASSEKKSSKTIDVTGQDLSTQMLDSSIAKTQEFQDKLIALKDATDKYKASMIGRVPALLKADEPELSNELQKNLAADTPAKADGKKSKQASTITAFPSDWEGRWSGPALLDQMVFSKVLQTSQPQAVTSVSGSMHPGRVGYCELVFDATADSAKLQQFPQVTFKVGPAEAPFIPNAKIGQATYFGTAPARNTVLSDGGIKNSEQLFNKLTQLKSGIIEQDMGERSVTVRRARQVSSGLRENVIYYSMVGPDQMYIYIAQIDYLPDGKFKSKLAMHGVLKRKHETA